MAEHIDIHLPSGEFYIDTGEPCECEDCRANRSQPPAEQERERCPTCGSLTPQFAYERGCTDSWHQENDRCPTCGNPGRGEVYGTCPDPFHSQDSERGEQREQITLYRARDDEAAPWGVSFGPLDQAAFIRAYGDNFVFIATVPATQADQLRQERDQWKRAANGDATGVVTHEYHLRVLKAVVAEREAAEADLAHLREQVREFVEWCEDQVRSAGRLDRNQEFGHAAYVKALDQARSLLTAQEQGEADG